MLIPQKESQTVNFDMYEKYLPGEYKLEMMDGLILPWNNEREEMLLFCLYNSGLERLVEILPEESKVVLRELLKG